MLAGVCCGLSFLTRFAGAIGFMFLGLLAYLRFSQKLGLKKIFVLLLCYGMGFLLTVVLMLVVLAIPLKPLYEHLIVVNLLRSRHRNDGIVFIQVIYRLIKSSLYLCKYTFALITVCL